MESVQQIRRKIPSYVLKIADKLRKENYKAYLVGGSVRDILFGRDPKDYDIATDARPNEIISIFPKAISTGAKFGSVIVIIEDNEGESFPVDVTTFRVEKYTTGRWPSEVEFINDINADLSRRDFTINAMAIDLDPEGDTAKDILIDPFGGHMDLKNNLIRAVGNPSERLKEDALRALRACRFASVFGFDIDPKLKMAIRSVLTMVDDLSAERVRDEIKKIVYDSPKPSIGFNLMKETGLLKIWIPELLEGIGVEQPEFHVHDVFEHTLRTVDKAEDSVKLAALFHDIAKPRTEKGGHFYRHDVIGAEMTKEIMQRLRFSNREIERVSSLVRWHMFYFPYDEEDYQRGKKIAESEMQKKTNIAKWKDAAVRRFVKNVGGEDAVDELFKLRLADVTANPKAEFDEREIQVFQERIAKVRKEDMALKITDLDVNGKDILALGFEKGPRVGEILRDLLDMVIEDPSINDKKTLIKIIYKKYGQGTHNNGNDEPIVS